MHPLDRPVWSALTSNHSHFAVGELAARRYDPEISPFAAAQDDLPESLAALGELVRSLGRALLLQAGAVVLPAGAAATSTAAGVQMVAERFTARAPIRHRIEPLGPKDAPEMLALATLTKPGPFLLRTPELGEFVGVREDGALIAMAGERMRLPGFTELSGVCTHPDHRGRGLAGELSAAVAARIAARGETPFLHAYAANTTAIRLYEDLGFRIRSPMHVAMIEPIEPASGPSLRE